MTRLPGGGGVVVVAWLVAALGVGSCQRLVGIHGARDAAAVDDTGASRPDLAPDLGPGDAGAADRGVEIRADAGDTGDGPTAGDTGDGPIAGDTGDGPIAGDTGRDVVGPDANRCGDLWHGANAQAGIFSIAASATTACGFAAATLPTFTAALNTTDFRGALACGSCLRVQPVFGSSSVVVQVVDLGGASGLLLSQPAMNQIATAGTGSLAVDWQLVACDVQNQTLGYFIKDGSNANYLGIQIRHQRYPVASVVAVGNSGQTLPFALQSYNYWLSTVAGVGAAPLTLRLTDINGQIVEDSGVGVTALMESAGLAQFPPCQ